MLRVGAGRLAQLGRGMAPVGLTTLLPAVLTGSVARWDAATGVTPDTTNGGYKWAPETGTSSLVTASGTGPDYSATGLGGKPTLLLSAARSFATSPAVSTAGASNQIFTFMVVQMAAPSASGAILLGNTINSAPAIYIQADGSVQILRANSATVANYPAGTMPFNQRVVLFWSHTSAGVHTLRVNKVAITATSQTAGAFTSTANVVHFGRFGTSSAASDYVGNLSFFEVGVAVPPPTGQTLTDYEAAVYNRWVA